MLIIALAIISILGFVLSVRQERRRFVNIVLFVFAAGLTSYAIDWCRDDGWLYTHLVSYVFFLFAIACVLLALTCLVGGLTVGRESRRSMACHLAVGAVAVGLIPFFYHTAGGILFAGIGDALRHLILFYAIYLVFSFLILVCYTFLSHLTPTKTRWDYLLFVRPNIGINRLSVRLQARLDNLIQIYRTSGRHTRIILPQDSMTEQIRTYLIERGIEAESIRLLDTQETSWRMKLSALADEPAHIRPYHSGLVLTSDYLAYHLREQMHRLGLHGSVLGYPTVPAVWAKHILGEYRRNLCTARVGYLVVLVWWLAVCGLSIWW